MAAPAELRYENLNGRQKAGVLMVALGPEVAGQVFTHLTDEEVEALALEIADLRMIPKSVRGSVLAEFYELALAQEYISIGGMVYARDLLKTALGSGRAQDVMRRVQGALERRDFHLLRKVDPAQLDREHAYRVTMDPDLFWVLAGRERSLSDLAPGPQWPRQALWSELLE